MGVRLTRVPPSTPNYMQVCSIARVTVRPSTRRICHLDRSPKLSSAANVFKYMASVPESLMISSSKNEKSPFNERNRKLGKTVQELHERLPTLLVSPLPQDILSPQISLRLFPSTYPHLPTVSGRIAYPAALWTAPVAWGRFPVVGNVRLDIISERMFKEESVNCGLSNMKLIVHWKTCERSAGEDSKQMSSSSHDNNDAQNLMGLLKARATDDGDFSGLFVFEFDDEGRVLTHIIEHAQECRNWKRMTKVVSVTDWLIGKAKGTTFDDQPDLTLEYCEINDRGSPHVLGKVHIVS